MTLTTVNPCRLIPSVNPSTTASIVNLPGSNCGLPVAPAYATNVTVRPTNTALGFWAVWPQGAQPVASLLNLNTKPTPGGLIPNPPVSSNGAILSADPNGAFRMRTDVTTAMTAQVDVTGYFASTYPPGRSLAPIILSSNTTLEINLGGIPFHHYCAANSPTGQ